MTDRRPDPGRTNEHRSVPGAAPAPPARDADPHPADALHSGTQPADALHPHVLAHQRWELLSHVSEVAHKPMMVLSFAWVALFIVQMTLGLDRFLIDMGYGIWALFIIQFLIEFTIAPHKLRYLEQHWLTAVALLLPAIRIVHIIRFLRVLQMGAGARSVVLVQVITSLNRGMVAARTMLGRRGVGSVAVMLGMVVLAGAAGILQFESPKALAQAGLQSAVAQGAGIKGYGDAAWYTFMILTTLGSAYWPLTAEGRVLTALLSLVAVGTLGYVTAVLASYFVGQDQTTGATPSASDQQETSEIASLREEVQALQREVASLSALLRARAADPPR